MPAVRHISHIDARRRAPRMFASLAAKGTDELVDAVLTFGRESRSASQ